MSATFRNKTVKRELKVGERLRTECLRWPSHSKIEFPLPPEDRQN